MTSGICSICNHPTKPLLRKFGYPLTKCGACCLIMMDPQPTPETLAKLYSPEAGYHATYSDEFIASQRHEFTIRIKEAERLIGNDSVRSIFDIGSANGLFLDCAKERGWTTAGIEMNKANVILSNQHGHQVIHGSLDDITPEGAYSLVHMGDVIEHMLDPRSGVQKSHTLLSRNGLLIVATPNASPFFQRISLGLATAFGIDWPHALPPAHTFQFSSKNLDMLMKQEGFSRVHDRYLNTSFMEEMRDTEYFQTIYHYLKKRQGSFGRFILHTMLFILSGILFFPLWLIGQVIFFINHNGSHETVWYRKD